MLDENHKSICLFIQLKSEVDFLENKLQGFQVGAKSL